MPINKTKELLLRATLLLTYASCLGLPVSELAFAQSAFAPPPPPAGVPSAVRGVYSPNQTPASPATLAPPGHTPPRSNANDNAITPTPTGGATPLEEGTIVARVDGQIILASDVLWQVNQIIAANRDRIPPQEIDKAKQVLLKQQVIGLIDTKLLYADFRRTVPNENIPSIEKNLAEPFEEQEVPRMVKMLKLKDRRALAEFFGKNGTSLSDVQRQFNERTIAGEWLRQVSPKPKPVTHEEMLAYYEEHRADYEYPAQAKWEEVMIRFSKSDGDRNKAYRACAELGNEIWQHVSNNPQFRGPAFAEIAPQKSHGFTAKQGGMHDWTTKDALRSQEINDALFSLQIGQLSNIIESEQGFHIVRVLERKDAGCTPFTETQADIRKLLEKKKQQELIAAEMVKLRKKSSVWTVFDGELTGPEVSRMLDESKRR